MGAREELRLLNRRGHSIKLGNDEFGSVAGVTSGWGLIWDDTEKAFYPTDLTSHGAPKDAHYVLVGSAIVGLTEERLMRVGAGITMIDGGAAAAVTFKTWFASEAQGDVIYRGSANWARLAAGTTGQVLTSGGAGANPFWSAKSSGGPVILYDSNDAGISWPTASIDTGTLPTGTKTHLRAWYRLRSNYNANAVTLQFTYNNDTTNSNYSRSQLYGASATAYYNQGNVRNCNGVNAALAAANDFSMGELRVPFYRDTDRILRGFIYNHQQNAYGANAALAYIVLTDSTITGALTRLMLDNTEGGNWISGSRLIVYEED